MANPLRPTLLRLCTVLACGLSIACISLITTHAVAQSNDAAPATSDSAAALTLENTYWKLLSLRGKTIEVADKKREPYLILQAARQQLMGSSGCNRLQGSYTLTGEQLSFARAPGTVTACKQGMEQERDFLDALATATHWRIAAQRLELLDAKNEVVAQFEPRYL